MLNVSKSACYLIILTVCTSFVFILFSLHNESNGKYFPQEQRSLPRQFKVLNNERDGNSPNRKLFDVDFAYLINNKDVCRDQPRIRTVILVTSFAGHVETRSAMRRAFSRDDLHALNMTRVFLLADGSKSKYSVSQKALLDENKRYGDLVQGNFFEAYKNLTYKHVMGLRWAAEHCRNVSYVVKMDDDIVVNVYQLAELLRDFKFAPFSPMAGYVLSNMLPIREPANKWYVTREEFSGVIYPPFVSGWFYITTPQLCANISETVSEVPYFWIDDVYVTGILAEKLNVRHRSIPKYFTLDPNVFNCCVRDIQRRNYDCDAMVGPNGGDNNLFYTFNKGYSLCVQRKCKKRPEGKSTNVTCGAKKKVDIGRGVGSIGTYPLT